MRRIGVGVVVFLALSLVPAAAARRGRPPKPAAPDAATAVRRSIALVQRGAAAYISHQECFSCHHQAMPMMTGALAQARGVPVEAAGLRRQIDFTTNAFYGVIDEMRRGLGVQGAND